MSVIYRNGSSGVRDVNCQDNGKPNFDRRYKQGSAAFGTEPMPQVVKAVDFLATSNVKEKTALDLGVGDGRHALYLLESGFRVTGVDLAQSGLDVLYQRAQKFRDKLTLINANVLDLDLTNRFSLIIGLGLLHFLSLENIKIIVDWVQKHTNQNGINVFVSRMTQNRKGNLPYVFEPGVMRDLYDRPDWKVLEYDEGDRVSIIAQRNN